MHVHAEIYIYILDTYRRNYNDARRKTSLEKYVPLTLLQGFEKVIQCLRVRGRTEIFWPPLLWPSTLCLSRSPDAQPEALGSTLLGAGFLCCILSVSSLDPKSSGPQGPFGLMLLSLPHLGYNSVSSSYWNSNSTQTVTQLSYIIVQRPLDRPLDLWNRMFNRHQAEITVMQFRGHSLPVRQSMRVSWNFLACPILLANFRPRDFLS